MSVSITAFFYLVSAVCFIMSLRGLSSAATSRQGNLYGMIGMGMAIATTLLSPLVSHYVWIILCLAAGGGLGIFIAKTIPMTALPQLVAGFHSLVGLAAVCVAFGAYHDPSSFGIGSIGNIHSLSLFEMGLGASIGALTFSGSLIAFGKLQGLLAGKPIVFPGQHRLNALLGIALAATLFLFMITGSHLLLWTLVIVSLALGILLIVPIGGADMPVVVSMLNSYSGWAASGIGFTLNNNLLIITGALVGASGAILSYVMCKGMNRSIMNVILGGFGNDAGEGNVSNADKEQRPVKLSGDEDAAFLLQNAERVIIVPGYGMAVAQAQHALHDMAEKLRTKGIAVKYAIHPVAGRMPGHMNVLLAEAKVSYDDVFELDDINNDFKTTDVAFVIGANDITNPAAKTNKDSPIYGMPILDVESARTVLFVKRSLGAGYAGVENELFYHDNTFMVLGDAKKVCEGIVKALA